jgi:hypothetical protein
MPRKLVSQILSVELLNRVFLNDQLFRSLFIAWCDLRVGGTNNKQNEIRHLNLLYNNILNCHNELYPKRYVLITQLFNILFNDYHERYDNI